MFTMARKGVGPVNRFVAIRCQKIRLGLRGPLTEVRFLQSMHFPHLLQTDNIGVKLADSLAQVVDLQAASRPQSLDTFVNIVGGNTQYRRMQSSPFHHRRKIRRHKAWQHQNSLGIGVRTHLIRSGQIRQPAGIGVFAGIQTYRRIVWHAQTKNMFYVVNNARRVTSAPSGINFVNVFQMPIT